MAAGDITQADMDEIKIYDHEALALWLVGSGGGGNCVLSQTDTYLCKQGLMRQFLCMYVSLVCDRAGPGVYNCKMID